MQERHSNRTQYFNEQSITTSRYVIPYINSIRKIEPGTKVLEIGCGEGGNLLPFVDMGCSVVGIELLRHQFENAEKFYEHTRNKTWQSLQSDSTQTPTSRMDSHRSQHIQLHVGDR